MSWKLHAIITVEGTPHSQPRQRYNRSGQNYTPKDAPIQEWKALVGISSNPYRPRSPFEGPVKLDIEFYMPRPKALKNLAGDGYHAKKPDIDNLFKPIADMLTKIGMWRDDGQICNSEVTKIHHPVDGHPGCRIVIWFWKDD